jgi:Flp pilus assembly pilin Flp
MIDKIKSVWSDEEGLTTVEYALLLALLVVAAVAVWTTFGRQVKSSVSSSTNAMSNAMNG